MVKIARVRSVYNALGEFETSQTALLRRMQSEIRETDSAIRETSQSFLQAMARYFPRIDDLPLEAMTTARRIYKPAAEHDYADMVTTMRQKNALLREEISAIMQEHGDEVSLREKLRLADSKSRTAQQALLTALSTCDRLDTAMAPIGYRLLPINLYEMANNRPFTEEDVQLYSNSSWWRWISPKWREGRATWLDYQERGGSNLQADRQTSDSLSSRSKDAAAHRDAAKATAIHHQGSRDDVLQILTRIGDLQKTYKDDAIIHATVCADFVQILGHPAAARYFVATLPPVTGTALSAFAIKQQQYDAVRERLTSTQASIQAQFDKIIRDRGALRKHSQTHPQAEIIYDLDDAQAQQDNFAQAVESLIRIIQRGRDALQGQFNTPASGHIGEENPYDAAKRHLDDIVSRADGVLPNGEPATDESGTTPVSHALSASAPRSGLGNAFNLPTPELPAFELPQIEIVEEIAKPLASSSDTTDWGSTGGIDTSPSPD